MKSNLFSSSILLLLLFLFVKCSSTEETGKETELFPRNIVLSKCTLEENTVNWDHVENEKVHIVNSYADYQRISGNQKLSKEELNSYFSKFSLLLISLDEIGNEDLTIERHLTRVGEGEYELILKFLRDNKSEKGKHLLLWCDKIGPVKNMIIIKQSVGSPLPPSRFRYDKIEEVEDLKVVIYNNPSLQPSDFSYYISLLKLRPDDVEPSYFLTRKSSFGHYGKIFNFPQFAIDWDVPDSGLPVIISYDHYNSTFNLWYDIPERIYFDVELTSITLQ